MTKLVLAFGRARGLSHDGLAHRVLDELAPALLGVVDGRLVVDVVVRDPTVVAALRRPPADGVDVIVEAATTDATPVVRTALGASGLLLGCEGWWAEETVQRDELGGTSPGLKTVHFMERAPALSHAEFAHHWTRVHGPLALRHHPGLAKYVQNVVTAPATDGAREWDGIAELHFASLEDMVERMYDSPEGQRVIAEDVKAFVGRVERYPTRQHVLRP